MEEHKKIKRFRQRNVLNLQYFCVKMRTFGLLFFKQNVKSSSHCERAKSKAQTLCFVLRQKDEKTNGKRNGTELMVDNLCFSILPPVICTVHSSFFFFINTKVKKILCFYIYLNMLC